MKIVSTSYSKTNEFTDPQKWLDKIGFYTGILEELAKGHEVISIERINYEGEFDQNGVHYFFLSQKKKVTRFPLRLHRLIKQLKPNVVFVNGFIFPLQILQLRLKLGKAVKIIVLHRAEKPFNGVKRYLQKWADKCVDAYLFTSSEFGNEWSRNINVKKIHEVIQASSVFHKNERTVAEKITKSKGNPVFLWVGRLDANKDPVTVVNAFINYLSVQPLARLYMIYQTEELLNEVRSLIGSDSKAKEGIILVGKIPHQQMQEWYSSADFIISSSHYEGSGISVCEAMSCGCIPVVSDIISFRKMTGPGKCGLLYEPGNDKELLTALLKTRKFDIEKERDKTLKQFNEELSFEAIARKIKHVISSLNNT
jgi:glycosyltransferase involved in cell wall biosynthesis